MFGKKITSKDQLIKDLADEFDSCFDQSYRLDRPDSCHRDGFGL